MDPERWRRAFDVFKASIGRSADERALFVAESCRGDEEMRLAVEELVCADDSAGFFLEEPAAIRFLPESLEQAGAFAPPAPDFAGTERFTVVRSLGAGGMGIVYEVHDRSRDEIVALKTLLHANPAAIHHLKREFRALADVAHRNLVSLYELIVEPPHCFFTMELVNGMNLVDCVRDSSAGVGSLRASLARSVFQQLADGVSALHGHGKLHRDIKPSNVLVTPEGRVVILDFGLITDLESEAGNAGIQPAGTPAYISPEDISGVRATEASDWYSVGITMYEALTGRVPFEGPFDEQLRRKVASDPTAPSQLSNDVPADLSSICMDLIARDLRRRLSGRDALRELGRPSQGALVPAPVETSRDPPFVGRQPALAILHRAFATVCRGDAASVSVHGPSGIGKSALVRRFLDELAAIGQGVILRSRCYERESVPYGALDGLIDGLSRYLNALPPADTEALLPRDSLALSRVFPAVLQVEAVSAHRTHESEEPDPLALRGRAFAALRELLNGIASRRPLILCIDDLHWADADSLVLLDELLRPSTAPPLLTLLCFRSEETASKPFLQTLLEPGASGDRVTVALGPMADDEAHQLIASLIPSEATVEAADRQRIAREAGGNPFLLEQMARYVTTGDAGFARPATVADMLGARLRALPHGAREFLDTLAICARPMPPQLIHEACGLTGDERPLVASLRSAHLLRSSGSAAQVELYHDRIRQTLTAHVSADAARRIHGAIAQTLVARRASDPQALFEHYRGAGDDERASAQAALAAEQAAAALAFDRAGFFYRSALELAPNTPAALEWKHGLATALANAGRPPEAAAMYLEAADVADPLRRIELQRRAAEQFLIGGHIDRGLAVIRTVLAAVRLRLAAGPRVALASLLFRRVLLRWRGLDFVERTPERVGIDDLLRIDTCWSVVTGLMLVDNIRAADFQTRHLLLALDAGEPFRIARALAVEAIFRASRNSRGREGSAPFAVRAQAMSVRIDRPQAIALATVSAGMSAMLIGQWRKATELCERALAILQDRCVGTTWEVNLAQNLIVGSLMFRGELRDAAGRLPDLLAAAQERGNLYFETELRTRMNLAWLAADDPDEGQRQADQAMERWSDEGFHRQHYNHTLARVQTDLYRGSAESAWRSIERNWPDMKRTGLLRIQFLIIEASYLRARCALLMVGAGGNRRRFLSIARRDARRIARERMAWSNPVSLLLDAAVAWHEGRTDSAVSSLERAMEEFDRAEMQLYAAVTRRRLGALVQGARGRDLARRGDDWMASQDVRNPALMTRMIAPGFPD